MTRTDGKWTLLGLLLMSGLLFTIMPGYVTEAHSWGNWSDFRLILCIYRLRLTVFGLVFDFHVIVRDENLGASQVVIRIYVDLMGWLGLFSRLFFPSKRAKILELVTAPIRISENGRMTWK